MRIKGKVVQVTYVGIIILFKFDDWIRLWLYLYLFVAILKSRIQSINNTQNMKWSRLERKVQKRREVKKTEEKRKILNRKEKKLSGIYFMKLLEGEINQKFFFVSMTCSFNELYEILVFDFCSISLYLLILRNISRDGPGPGSSLVQIQKSVGESCNPVGESLYLVGESCNPVGESLYLVGESLVALDGRIALTGECLLSVDLDDNTRHSLLQQGNLRE